MAIANKTVAQLTAAYHEAGILVTMLRDYNQGTPAPAIRLGQFTVAEIEAQVTAAKAAIDAINAA